MKKKTIRKCCLKCNAVIVTEVMVGPTITPVQCPECQSFYELVSQRCADCLTMRFILTTPGGRTGNLCDPCREKTLTSGSQKVHGQKQSTGVSNTANVPNTSSPVRYPKSKKAMLAFFGVLAAVTLPTIIASFIIGENILAPSRNIEIGEMGVLSLKGGLSQIPVATTEAYYSEMVQTESHDDKEGLLKMTLEGKLRFVEKNTPVRVIGKSVWRNLYHIRITAGEYVLEDGWVPTQWVK